ncbi:Homoserine O-acetyltransferase [sediment metagenome]|uniref:Homoserine O-acetyltransferase n=1 Tax=sediment metagenome TaxID=749907 RepID=D9PH91_9ZZZZ
MITFASDWLYPSHQLKELVNALKANDIDVSDIEINSDYGHDAFLIDNPGQALAVGHFLKRILSGQKGT